MVWICRYPVIEEPCTCSKRIIIIIIRWKCFSFSLARGPPRDLQIIAYKYDSAHSHNRLVEFNCKHDSTHA